MDLLRRQMPTCRATPTPQISPDLSRSLQISPDLSRSLQISPDLSRSLHLEHHQDPTVVLSFVLFGPSSGPCYERFQTRSTQKYVSRTADSTTAQHFFHPVCPKWRTVCRNTSLGGKSAVLLAKTRLTTDLAAVFAYRVP